MRNLKPEELLALRDALDEFMQFINELHGREIPYFYQHLDYMKNNIEFCVCTQSDDLEHLEELLIRDWNLANDAYLGIPSYEIFDDDGRESVELCIRYAVLLAEIEKYFTYKEKMIEGR